MTKEEYTQVLVQKFKVNLEIGVEIPDNLLTDIYTHYFEKKSLTEANNYVTEELRKFADYDYDRDKINWSLSHEELEKTPEYIKFKTLESLQMAQWRTENNFAEVYWVNVNGQKRTDEEAATVAADKWCELCFGWHLQDNGALNEEHSFVMSLLGTMAANDAKDDISEEVKKKAHQNIKDYYLHYINYSRTGSSKNIDWAEMKFPDNDKKDPFPWKWGFSDSSMYCDYGPATPLYLLLIHSGVDEKDARAICPWKTGIYIRAIDNSVMYRTYGKVEEL